jgi:hypothetical protein
MSELAAAFRARSDFRESGEDTFTLEGLDFDGEVVIAEGTATLEQELPTLDATVIGETVAPVVEDGWLETFERRVGDVTGVTADDIGEPTVRREHETVHVRIDVGGAEDPPAAARHAATYVEGTWVEGIIPGYDYEARVQAIRERAMSTGEEGAT